MEVYMMKFKFISASFILLLLTNVSFGQNAEKILVKSFNLQGNKTVVLDLEGNTTVENWNENYLRIQMTIGIENGSDAMLKSLIKAGRYNLKGESAASGFEVQMPNIEKTVTVGGRALEEQYSFVIFAPQNVSVENINEASAALEVEFENQFK